MIQFFKDILRVWWHELVTACHDTGILLFVLVVPLGYPLLYYSVYATEVAEEVAVAVVDESHSALSRDFVRRLDATQEADVVARCQDMAEAQELLRRREVYGIVRLPRTLAKDVAQGTRAFIGVYTDVSSMIYYKNIMLPATLIVQDMNKDIKVDRIALGGTDQQVAVARQPIAYDHVKLYNPTDGYAAFLIPPIMMVIIQQTLVIGLGMGMGRTREKWCDNSVVPLPFYRNGFCVTMGKMMVYWPLYIVLGLYMYSAITWGFGLPQLGHLTTWLAFIVPYVTACCAFGIVCSSMVFRREDAILLFVFMSVPLLFLSGVSWPSCAIPDFWKYVSWLFPSTFGCNAHIRITAMGADFATVWPDVRALWIQSIVYFGLACAMQHRHACRADKRVTLSRAEEIMKTPRL